MRLLLLTLAAVLGLVLAAGSAAAVAPVFTRSVARVGERVGVVQPVRIGRPLHGRTGIVVYLIPLSLAPSGVSDGPPPRSLAGHRLGELVGDRHGYWRLSFRVPHLRPGAYTTLIWLRRGAGGAFPHGSVFAGGYLADNGVLNVRR
jgi:hypothetical protein